MKSKIKKIVKSVVGPERISQLRDSKKNNRILLFFELTHNFIVDFKLYYRDSTLFERNKLSKKEAKIILEYHRVEKGLLFAKTKPRFAEKSILILHALLRDEQVLALKSNTQILIAIKILCQYYELHQNKLNIDIEDYFSQKQYLRYKDLLGDQYSPDFEGTLAYNTSDFYQFGQSNFYDFSNSRKSVRSFTGEKVHDELVQEAIQLAINAPSVCNRQASKVYLVDDKNKIDKILAIQGGFSGYIENVSQLLILTVNRNYFYTVGERNQFYIDGGIFLMNLLYSLHFYKIANCPANWGKPVKAENKLSRIIKLPESEKIICLIPIGKAADQFKVCLSKRRDIHEVLYKI